MDIMSDWSMLTASTTGDQGGNVKVVCWFWPLNDREIKEGL